MATILRLLTEEHLDHDESSDDGEYSSIIIIKIVVMVLVFLSGCFVFFPFSKFVKAHK